MKETWISGEEKDSAWNWTQDIGMLFQARLGYYTRIEGGVDALAKATSEVVNESIGEEEVGMWCEAKEIVRHLMMMGIRSFQTEYRNGHG